MDWLTHTLTLFGQPTSALELLATLFSAICVFLVVKRNVISYPVGILGTILFFFVFWNAGLKSSAYLQVFFTAVQFYGWWFWLRGDQGKVPKISRFLVKLKSRQNYIFAAATILLVGVLASRVGPNISGPDVPLLNAQLDGAIFGMSVLAQIGMDRKKLEHWMAWIVVDVISIGHYWNMGLHLTSGLYLVFLGMAIWGLVEWRRVYKADRSSTLLNHYAGEAT